jgi:hypothetical protein
MNELNTGQVLICNDCKAAAFMDENSTGYCEQCGSADVRHEDRENLVLVIGHGHNTEGIDMNLLQELADKQGLKLEEITMFIEAPERPHLDAIKADLGLPQKQSETPYHKDIMKRGRNQFKNKGKF